jgi:hypothetical protein
MFGCLGGSSRELAHPAHRHCTVFVHVLPVLRAARRTSVEATYTTTSTRDNFSTMTPIEEALAAIESDTTVVRPREKPKFLIKQNSRHNKRRSLYSTLET